MGETYMKRLIPYTFSLVACVFFFLLAVILFSRLALSSKASDGSVTLRILTQGIHRQGDTLKARIIFYNGPEKTFEEQAVPFAFVSGAFQATVSFASGFNYADRYALFVKPEKHAARIFCNDQLTGKTCTTPYFAFLEKNNTVDLTPHVFLAGDIPPGNGKVDAADMSMIMRDLGKMASGEASTDVNNDKITDVVDYSLALYSLAQQAQDDTVHLTRYTPSPTASPSATVTPAPSLKPTVPPSATPAPPAPTPSLKPTATPPPPTPTRVPTPTVPPTPTPLPKYGKNCTNGTAKVTKPLNPKWNLNVLPVPYGHSQYMCVNASNVVLHWSDSPNFLGNGATWGALNSRNRLCGLAIDDKETLQMSNFYDDKVTWEGCSTLDDAINIEINGTMFDLWYDGKCNIVNPKNNKALAAGELEQKKQQIANQYGVSSSVMDWENERYVAIMEAQEKRVLDAVRYLLLFYDIPKEKVTGHFKVSPGKIDPGARFLDCIIGKL